MKTILTCLLLCMVAPAKSVYDFSYTAIDGKEIKLSAYKGKKILLVNTASKCGFTPQYKALQLLSERYSDNLIVIGFPANNFNQQEPGDNQSIKSFCEKNYGVSFPLSEKVSVLGNDIDPLFKYLCTIANTSFSGDIKWNFEKFLIDENGKLIARFPSKTDPLDKSITSKL